ncbi:hypothetical protein A3K34_03775 [candidate division WWE3 bacterium RIFOXYC1_FULL_40_10]|uniref:Uncharacterized protein n=1 Tax=candidate division WWE3 bacterium RIFOXYA2_FULL_46_9 TaxID=1802636 RepID=A0A1F4W2Z5_UNCKA|nr:MAG: hypothetical protein A3K58_03775 [candidate division WWE3 bacterium RIFOXYB1_FULL_40_22]OGC61960.1 MAG: hypothetical protein A3K37_03775 [candidate division WWE3 bacterium RIFOXYA1_FULL_40_11]OGC63786.1 MAG: hypothetical protein A2264_02725 [candidate division WWE3 bacterium RIFOXYA2_FULL_46_9]OGC64517.1 MAG: hypothetical protein A2326_03915 [candidate division WWE3 bacterium RIFOXYB2_FULL_41_6]OGC66343.1 MAG: hypothetical protein A3K34_03775 [candidate division WWE3 bacterium RIFOXYC1_
MDPRDVLYAVEMFLHDGGLYRGKVELDLGTLCDMGDGCWVVQSIKPCGYFFKLEYSLRGTLYAVLHQQ